MKKYMVIYNASAKAQKDWQKQTKEDMKKGMEAWMMWKKSIGKGLVDMGNPLGNGQIVNKNGSSKGGSHIVGYSILQAKDMDSAKKMLYKHPHMKWVRGCDIQVFEAMKMPV